MAILEINNLEYYYQDGENIRYILKNLSCSFDKGVFYTIKGQSGSGKTTLLSLISALDVPMKGTICYEQKELKAIGYEKYRRNKIGIIFQYYNLIPYLTGLENIELAMCETDNEVPKNKKEVAYNLLDFIGITKTKADRQINKLSGGEQQRVAIARSLATNVDIILADEPTGNLDASMQQEIVDIFKTLAHEHNKCVIVVTHNDEIAKQADESFVLSQGELVKDE